jgi:hypothetical protein
MMVRMAPRYQVRFARARHFGAGGCTMTSQPNDVARCCFPRCLQPQRTSGTQRGQTRFAGMCIHDNCFHGLSPHPSAWTSTGGHTAGTAASATSCSPKSRRWSGGQRLRSGPWSHGRCVLRDTVMMDRRLRHRGFFGAALVAVDRTRSPTCPSWRRTWRRRKRP